METELDYRDVKSLPNWSLNIALSLIHLNEINLAKEKLVKCLSDHPGLLFPLLEKMQGNIYGNVYRVKYDKLAFLTTTNCSRTGVCIQKK